jgi:site-specific DNA recombinase
MSHTQSNSTKTRAVLYLRVSTEEQVTNFSLANQEEVCRKEAERIGVEVVQVFREAGRSAKTMSGRPVLMEMMDYCRKSKKEINCVITYRIDRISRKTVDYITIRSKLREYDIELVSATEPTDSNPTGNFIETMLASFAQLDNDVKSERSKAGLLARYKAGLISTTAPLGYLNRDGMAVIDPATHDYVRQAWEMMSSGAHSLEDVVIYFRKNHVVVIRSEKLFAVRKQTVSRIFRNKFYCGFLTSSKYASEVKGQHQAMISESTFYNVQSLLDGRGPNRSETPPKYIVDNPEFPLRRILYCNKCGKPMTGAFSKGKLHNYGYYFCPNRCGTPTSINRDNMEVQLLKHLDTIQPTQACVDKFMKDLRQKYLSRNIKHQKSSENEGLEIAKLKDTRQTLVDKNLAGLYPDRLFQEQLRILDKKIRDAYEAQNQANVSNYDFEALCNFILEKLARPAKTYEEACLSKKKALLCSIYPNGIKWMHPGISNTGISPYYQQIRNVSETDVPFGAPEGTRTPDLDVRTVLLYPAELQAHKTYRNFNFSIIITACSAYYTMPFQFSNLP